ncbi:MAG: class I tRNA ligase family protein, partial [bacterium]|nr:class I tRNA ligase family protein [bacterium]
LPGNVALAVHEKISYVLAQKGDTHYILAKELAEKLLGEHKVIKTFLGSELVGTAYTPLFRFGKGEQRKKIWEVVPAGFVSVKEGTGIVHTAVAYGQDDFELGKKENLAMLHLVDERGKFKAEVVPWKGMFVKEADPLIIEDLKQKGLLLKEELYEHEYPFCWRCSTPLLYYAKDSWFLNMQKVKKEILKNNDSINWIPSHMKKGRMGEWLKELKDWAFSRERYWGTPLPVWQCKKCNNMEVIGSLKELLSQSFSQNTYTLLRHGHSERQVLDIMSSWPEKKALPLTEKGIKQIEKAAKELKKKKIDLIFSSDLLRTKQTAEIVGKALGVTPILEERLREWNVGVLNGKPLTDLGKVWGKPNETSEQHYMRRFVEPLPEGESYSQVQKRVYEFLQDVEKKYKGKNILIVSHELPLTLLETTMRGLSRQEMTNFRQKEKDYLVPGEWRQIPFATLPLNETMELDFHRPYIDEVKFHCKKCAIGTMERVKDVVDVWFDSGAMPFAQNHWMGGVKPKEFPADYIVEGIDQTRGWFYTLLAVSTLLGFKAPFRNVISFNHVLDQKGEKMSKSKGNVVNPWDMIQKYGIDAVR